MTLPDLTDWRGDLLALAAGVALVFAFAPFDLYPLAILAPALLFLALEGVSPRRAARRGLLFGLGLFGVGVSWVFVAIHVYGDSGVAVAALLTALFVTALAGYPALFAFGAARLRPGEGGAFWYLGLLPALWLASEWLRGWLFTGFTWLQLGYSQEQSPLAGLAPLLGVYGIGLACAVSAGALAWWLRGGRRAVPALLAVVLLWLAAFGAARIEWTHPQGKPLRVALIQDNLPQATKWDPDQFDQRLNLYAKRTLEWVPQVDAVIWPENAITVFYRDLKDNYFDWLATQARNAGTDLVVGLPMHKAEGKGYYTSLMLMGVHDGVYHKHHLVPFGEFVPLQGLLRGLIKFFDLPMSGFSPGPADQAPLPVAGRLAAMSICYEDAFGEELLHNFPAATLLVNGSNNAWYGDSFAPHQHLEISRMRTIETGRPLVRATTTGISALVDHHGRVLVRSMQFESTVLHGEVQPMAGTTPYMWWGNWPVLLLCWGLIGWGWRSAHRKY